MLSQEWCACACARVAGALLLAACAGEPSHRGKCYTLPGTAKLKEEFGDAVCTSNFDVVSQASFCDCGPLLKQPLMASNALLWLSLPLVYMLDPGAAASASSPPSEERRRLELSADRAPAVVPPPVPRKHGRAAGALAGRSTGSRERRHSRSRLWRPGESPRRILPRRLCRGSTSTRAIRAFDEESKPLLAGKCVRLYYNAFNTLHVRARQESVSDSI